MATLEPCRKDVDGFLLSIEVVTDGFDVVLNCTNCCSNLALDSFNFRIASCLFLNLSLLSNASPVVLLVVLTGMSTFAPWVLSDSFDSSFD